MSSQQFYSPEEFSQHSGLSLATVHRYRRSGKLPFVQPGGPRHRILIPCDALDQILTPSTDEKSAKPTIKKPADTPPPLSGPQPRWLRDPPY